MKPCHWVFDSEVPGGKFLVPGCWSRAVGSDFSPCHCTRERGPSLKDRISKLEARVQELSKAIPTTPPKGETE